MTLNLWCVLLCVVEVVIDVGVSFLREALSLQQHTNREKHRYGTK